MTDGSTRPQGQRFSHVYLRSPDLLQDSERARRRAAAILDGIKDANDAYSILPEKLGIDPVVGVYGGVNWRLTFKDFETRDFLDFITLVYRYLNEKKRGPMYAPDANLAWRDGCRVIFSEENLSYEIDDLGGVHFKVDAEFAASKQASIVALGAPRYANARVEFEKAMKALSVATPDGKEAIRGVFNAVECVYRLIYSKAHKLTSADAIRELQALLQKLYSADPRALRAANPAVKGFGDWIDACHNYRHEEGKEDPSQPPIDLAIYLISTGSAHLRWLISLDPAG